MQIRQFGQRSGYQVNPVSIGAMRFPRDGLDAVALIRHAIDSGMRYIDTSRGYGESELILGRALKGGYRQKVILSSKWAPWITKIRGDDDGSADSVRRRIDETLLRLDVDYLDFYQVWNINNSEAWDLAQQKGGMVEGIRRAMAEGLVRYTGFTAHDKPDHLLEMLPQADWAETILVSYNLLKRSYEPVLQKARELGLATVVMNPVGGGKLAEASPVLGELAREVGATSVPDLAVRFVLSNPNVDTILCGMNKLSDVDDTIASAERPAFTPEQLSVITEFLQKRSRKSVGFCTNCRYCMPCPTGIDIPKVMRLIYDDRFLGFRKAARNGYKRAGKVLAEACTRCGECEPKCTQQLKVMEEMAYAAKEFGDDGGKTS